MSAVACLSGLLAEHAELYATESFGDAWQDYLLTRLLEAENAFTRKAELADSDDLSPALFTLAEQDLAIVQRLFTLNAAM